MYLKYVEVVLTTFCTLKCRECSNYINLYQKPYHVEIKTIECSIDRLLKVVGHISTVGLLGGEPFLYPELGEVIDYLCDKNQIDHIRIVTNGTVIPKNKALYVKMAHHKVYVQINEYQCSSDSAKRLSEILQAANVQVHYVDRFKDKWRKYNASLCEYNEEKLEEQFLRCHMMCRSILNGKFFYCPRSAHGNDLNIFEENNYIDLLSMESEEVLVDKLQRLICNTRYLEACKYCNSGTTDFIEINAAVQDTSQKKNSLIKTSQNC